MNKHWLTALAIAGLAAGCSRSVESASQQFNELPPAVQKTARAQMPNGEIANVSKTTRDGMEIYEIEFRGAGSNSKIQVGTDGRLVSTDLPRKAGAVERALTPTGAVGTKLSALPEAVQKTIQSRAPNAQIADISRHEKDGRVFYTVEFSDKGKNPTMEVAEDGSLVQDLQK